MDVVLLATPPHFRPIHLAACVAAGKHVFCEKPMAVDAPGVRAVLAACAEAEKEPQRGVRPLLPARSGHERNHAADQKRGHRQNRCHSGNLQVQPTLVPQQSPAPGVDGNGIPGPQLVPLYWLSGDHIVEQHVHSLDKACWALDGRVPQKAWGMGGRQVRSDVTIGQIFDHHAVCYQYADGVRVYSYSRRQAGCFNETPTYPGHERPGILPPNVVASRARSLGITEEPRAIPTMQSTWNCSNGSAGENPAMTAIT